MKRRFHLQFLLIWITILWGCTPEAVNPLPIMKQTQTQLSTTDLPPQATAISKLPDTWTPAPDTATPAPSATITVLINSATPSPTEDWPEPCQPGEFDAYYNVWVPIADQVIIMGREARQLQELPETRAEEILTETNRLKSTLDLVTVPLCMENAHQKTVDAINLLESSMISLLIKDYDKAKEELQESFGAIAWAMVDVGYLSNRETETSTPP